MTHFNALNGQNAYLSSRYFITKSQCGNDIDRMRNEGALSTRSVPLKMSKCMERKKAWVDVTSLQSWRCGGYLRFVDDKP
jgi:hypothetical protein